MPAGYGIEPTARGLLPWRWAEEQLAASRNYWVSTVRPDGRPHSMPVWGVWVDGALYFSSDAAARKAVNLKANPAVVVTTESGDEAVILEGEAHPAGDDPAALRRMDDAYAAKYGGLRPAAEPMPGSVIFVLRPRRAFGWRESEYSQSATRWRFE
jgi:PPOX class probable F420-dependent enzyme